MIANVKEFTKNDIVKNAIMNSLPNKIIVRGGEVEEGAEEEGA